MRGLVTFRITTFPIPSRPLQPQDLQLATPARHQRTTLMKNGREELSHFKTQKQNSGCGKVPLASGGWSLFSSSSPVAVAFIELQCGVPNFRGSALSSQQSRRVATATRKPLAAGTTVQAKTVVVEKQALCPAIFCFYALLNPCFPRKSPEVGVFGCLINHSTTTWNWPDSGLN